MPHHSLNLFTLFIYLNECITKPTKQWPEIINKQVEVEGVNGNNKKNEKQSKKFATYVSIWAEFQMPKNLTIRF